MTTKTKKIDVDSIVNQGIKGRFVAREVKACFSYEMEAILRNGRQERHNDNADYPLPNYDDIENLYQYKCPKCGEGQSEAFDSDNVKEGNERFDAPKKYKCYECGEEFTEEPEYEAQEVFEWWIVTEWLYEILKAKGCPVLQWGNNWYWGRCTTGQAISMDGVMGEICLDMEILKGQKYDWSK